MQLIHDVWVNWFEGEENSYNVCRFHEWRKKDKIELLDRIPVVKVEEELYEFIENDLQDLPKKLLFLIYKQTRMKKNQKTYPVEHAAIVSNGKDVIAFDTLGYNIPVKKSRLIPRHERQVLDMVENMNVLPLRSKRKIAKDYHILSLPPAAMAGLTRRERQLKQVLMMALDQLKYTEHEEELRYWLTEWNPEYYPFIKSIKPKQAWKMLYKETKEGWSMQHEEFCQKLIRGQAFFESLWKQEHKEEKAKSQN
ncbi:DUF3603 family protein [Salimicrobium halophilum]|uniref:Uncharacterized protein n=1 Tax=Salimicrobium halophilum TaxID=86666 RepID=A0A1G8TSN0_9BACI|nr:DUF3603 family protein [Salimicrobium halophilum]SDJ44606.1 Protein of unknown function [Salimicrobium halophilum]